MTQPWWLEIYMELTRHRLGYFRTTTAWGGVRPSLSREPKVVEDGRGGVSKVFGDYSKARLFCPKQVTCQVQYQVKCQNI